MSVRVAKKNRFPEFLILCAILCYMVYLIKWGKEYKSDIPLRKILSHHFKKCLFIDSFFRGFPKYQEEVGQWFIHLIAWVAELSDHLEFFYFSKILSKH